MSLLPPLYASYVCCVYMMRLDLSMILPVANLKLSLCIHIHLPLDIDPRVSGLRHGVLPVQDDDADAADDDDYYYSGEKARP